MAMELFSAEYKYVQSTMASAGFKGRMKDLLSELSVVMTDRGFSLIAGPKLDNLRRKLKWNQASKLLTAAGINPGSNAAPNASDLMEAASVKFLRHVYLIHERGAQKVWVFSCPRKYRHYPTDELWAVHTNMHEIKDRLGAGRERFSKTQRKRLGEATVNGAKHVAKAKIACIRAMIDVTSADMDTVKRWFADASTTDAQLVRAALKLYLGFCKVQNTLNSNHVIFTDMPSLRGASAGTDDYGFLTAYAFVYAGRYEKMPIIYIENAFFARNTTPIGQSTLWALTVVHETTHLDLSTKDHRYDYDGLRVGPNLSHAKALENADSWAYFAADCAGELNNNQRNKALRGW